MFNARPYAGPVDLPRLLELRQICGRAAPIVDWPTASDLENDLAQFQNPQERVMLWAQAEGALAAFAYIDYDDRQLQYFIHPNLPSTELFPTIVDWGEAKTRVLLQGQGEPRYVRVRPLDNQPEIIAYLEANGFQKVEWHTLRYVRSLQEPIPEAHIPDGFTIRSLTGEAEVPAYVALHRAAFGTENMTIESRLAFMKTQSYIPDLDLVAVAPAGTLAAFVVCSYDETENTDVNHQEAWTDPVGTRPEFQRRGLSKALLLTGMKALKARGIETTILGTGSDNTAMQRTAESVGYRRIYNMLVYEKGFS
jgi:ribosomal protein S18 acetylase RimI-like enzyme